LQLGIKHRALLQLLVAILPVIAVVMTSSGRYVSLNIAIKRSSTYSKSQSSEPNQGFFIKIRTELILNRLRGLQGEPNRTKS